MQPSSFVLVGHSHIAALRAGCASVGIDTARFVSMYVSPIEEAARASARDPITDVCLDVEMGTRRFLGLEPGLDFKIGVARAGLSVLLSLGGNEHNVVGLICTGADWDFVADGSAPPLRHGSRPIPVGAVRRVMQRQIEYFMGLMDALVGLFGCQIAFIESPPPIKDEAFILDHLDPYFIATHSPDISISPAELRHKLWRLRADLVAARCRKRGIQYVAVPETALQDGRYLPPDAAAGDATHANEKYGSIMVIQALDQLQQTRPRRPPPVPYDTQPDHAFWRRAVTRVPPREVDPAVSVGLTITSSTKVATAGSCFAEHIGRRLTAAGYCHFVTEDRPAFLDADIAADFNYGVFSARFGNQYTPRQLLQLLRRAYGDFQPVDAVWSEPTGGHLDPYRPTIQPEGFASVAEFHADRDCHFAATRRMIEDCDVLVFTLGLTECWVNRTDGAVYPLCPGVRGGRYDPDRHAFVNLTVTDVTQDLRSLVALARARNPAMRLVLTVSPVPLVATARDEHVLTATSYSKAVLRVAAETLATSLPEVYYFPAYEIIMSPSSRGAYFAEDCRTVTEAGVDHVMRAFFRNVAAHGQATATEAKPVQDRADVAHAAQRLVTALCDEEGLDRQPHPKASAAAR